VIGALQMHSPSPRAARVATQVQRSLASLLQRGINDPRVGNVTVTTVKVAPDLTVAYVQVLPFGSSHAAADTLAGLRSAAGYLRAAVARELNLRRAPRLEFELDVALEQAHRLTELIDRAVSRDRATGEDQPTSADHPGEERTAVDDQGPDDTGAPRAPRDGAT
jgi:ribosome-binding factor A